MTERRVYSDDTARSIEEAKVLAQPGKHCAYADICRTTSERGHDGE